MVLKGVLAAVLCTALLAWSNGARADDYRPDEFLKLDLKAAVLSPKRLGPPAQFEPVAVEAKADPVAKPVQTVRVREPAAQAAAQVSSPRTTSARGLRRHGPAQTYVARKHGNPLDAQASDTRGQTSKIQTWPCRSGGICGWQR
jgi:hypothetical protein